MERCKVKAICLALVVLSTTAACRGVNENGAKSTPSSAGSPTSPAGKASTESLQENELVTANNNLKKTLRDLNPSKVQTYSDAQIHQLNFSAYVLISELPDSSDTKIKLSVLNILLLPFGQDRDQPYKISSNTFNDLTQNLKKLISRKQESEDEQNINDQQGTKQRFQDLLDVLNSIKKSKNIPRQTSIELLQDFLLPKTPDNIYGTFGPTTTQELHNFLVTSGKEVDSIIKSQSITNATTTPESTKQTGNSSNSESPKSNPSSLPLWIGGVVLLGGLIAGIMFIRQNRQRGYRHSRNTIMNSRLTSNTLPKPPLTSFNDYSSKQVNQFDSLGSESSYREMINQIHRLNVAYSRLESKLEELNFRYKEFESTNRLLSHQFSSPISSSLDLQAMPELTGNRDKPTKIDVETHIDALTTRIETLRASQKKMKAKFSSRSDRSNRFNKMIQQHPPAISSMSSSPSSLSRLLGEYQTNSKSLRIIARVTESLSSIDQRRSNPHLPPEFIESSNSDYWIIQDYDNSSQLWLLPKSVLKVNQYVYETLQSLFNCHNYQNQPANFQVINPASVAKTPGSDSWQLISKGEIEFLSI